MNWLRLWKSLNNAVGYLIGIEEEGIEELRTNDNVKILEYSKCNKNLLNYFGLPDHFIDSEYICYIDSNKYYYFKFILDKYVIEERYSIDKGSEVYSQLL